MFSPSGPQIGQSGSRRTLSSVKRVPSESYSSSRPLSGSPMSAASLMTSLAWSRPITPAITPSTPLAPQLGSQLGRRRGREEAAVAGAVERDEGRDLALEAEDRRRDDRLSQPHRGVVQQVARGEVVGAVDDDVVGLDQLEDVRGVEAQVVLDHLDVGVERVDRRLRRRGLRLADRLGRVDHLALEVRLVDDVVVDDPERADAGGGEIERGRRTQARRRRAAAPSRSAA